MSIRNDKQPQFNWNNESICDSISELNIAPAPSLKVKPGNRLQFENFSVLSDSVSEAGSLPLPRRDCENYALNKANFNKSSKRLHFEQNINSENVSPPVWDYLKKQDEKLKMLENQVSTFLRQEKTLSPTAEKNANKIAPHDLKNKPSEAQLCELKDLESNDHHQVSAEPLSNLTAAESACKTVVETEKQSSIEKQLCKHNSSKVNDHYLNLILLYLKEQNDQIRKLQDQVDLVVKRTGELESFHSIMKERHFSSPGHTMYPSKSKRDQSSPFQQIRGKGKKISSPKFDSDQENKLDFKLSDGSHVPKSNKEREVISHEFYHSKKSREKHSPQNYLYPDCSSIDFIERCAAQSFTSSKRNRKFGVRLSSSSESSGDEASNKNPQYEKWDEQNAIKNVYDSSSISVYGIPTCFLSNDTKQYLEKNNLMKLRNSSGHKR